MIKKVLKIFPLLLAVIFLNNSEASAHKSIPDGNAFYSNGYTPYDVSSDAWAKRWSIKGNKGASDTSGRKLVYDIYSGSSGNQYKKKWEIQERQFGNHPKQKYLVFRGWAALQGYHHHTKENQATYILLYNPQTKQEKMYKAEMSNLDASEDMEYGRALSDDKTIYNPCAPDAFNKKSDTCNMYYKYVGFKAWIPLQDIFPQDKNTEWVAYIVKNVEGHVVYDELRLPFTFSKLSHNSGEISLSSDIDNDKLIMNSEGVIRRAKPRVNNPAETGKYFEKNKMYTKIDQDESAGTAIWYGVRSPEDNNKKRWSSSPFWTFGGSQAVLRYQVTKKKCPDGTVVGIKENCTVNVTIYHKDWDTKQTLKTETKKATVGQNYSFSPASKGTFKDKNGNPYVPYPLNQKESGKTPNNNFSITFYYRVALPDPTSIKEIPDGTVGKANGDFLWRLEKVNHTAKSRIRMINNLLITGKHYQTRNETYSVSTDAFNETDNKPIDIYLNNPNSLKGKDINYSFSYEYTNHYQENYKCVDSQGSDCFKWEFTGYTPVWGTYAKTAKWTAKLTTDHKYGETFVFTHTSNPTIELVVGRKATVNGTENAPITNSVQKEKYTVDNRLINVLSQTWIPINEKIEYHSDLNNPFYIIPEYMYYYPNDIDKNLRGKYKNQTPFNFSKYAIPLRVGKQNTNEIFFNTKDNFFITKNEGFVFSLPASITSTLEIEQKAKEEYESYTGQEFDDQVFFSDGSRYYFNIDGNGEEKPNTWYPHTYVISQLGLSDIQIQLKKQVKFDKYLIGSPIDDPLIWEEFDSVIPNIQYDHSVVIKADQIEQIKELANQRSEPLHSFRATDIKEKFSQLKSILPSLN